jgi:hypothetical protein
MNLRQAAQQALEALDLLAKSEHPATNFTTKSGGRIYPHKVAVDAGAALRTALAEPEQKPVAYVSGVYAGHFTVVPTNPALVLTTGMALYTHPVDDTALLRQALEALEKMLDDAKHECVTVTHWNDCVDTITALRERLGEKT